MSDELGEALAATVRAARADRAMSVGALAQASNVSRAMIGKIERGEVQPTAALLARLSGALGLTLSELIARAEADAPRLARYRTQQVWTDPDTGYVRRSVSPAGRPLQLVEVELPPGARVPMPAQTFTFIDQQIWVLEGRLRFHEGDEIHELDAGDCLQLGPPSPREFVNPTIHPCRYLVVLNKRGATG